MKICAVFPIDLDSISALHFSVVDTFKEKKQRLRNINFSSSFLSPSTRR